MAFDYSRGLEPTRFVIQRGPDEEIDEELQCAVPAFDELATVNKFQKISQLGNRLCLNRQEYANWDDIQSDWSESEQIIFQKVTEILTDDHLALLAGRGLEGETVNRLVYIDFSAMRIKRLLKGMALTEKIPRWLHSVLMDNLPPSYLSSYLAILQSLRNNAPAIFCRLVEILPHHETTMMIRGELTHTLEVSCNTQLPKLSKNAVILLLPTVAHKAVQSKHYKKWCVEFQKLATVMEFKYKPNEEDPETQDLEKVSTNVVRQACHIIREQRLAQAKCSIVLVGFNQSAALALQIAYSEKVECIICMGFASQTYYGPRGDTDDILLRLKTPVQFVIGQSSARTSQVHMELLRDKMLAVTGLVVVGGADDKLVPHRDHLLEKQVTREMVDAMVLLEVHAFIDKMLTNPPGIRKCMLHPLERKTKTSS